MKLTRPPPKSSITYGSGWPAIGTSSPSGRKRAEPQPYPKRPQTAAARQQQMRILEPKDIVRLLRIEVEKAGGQTVWAKRNGINRSITNKVLRGDRAPTRSIIRALGLRIIVVAD
jgi:DNA-binding phage protein